MQLLLLLKLALAQGLEGQMRVALADPKPLEVTAPKPKVTDPNNPLPTFSKAGRAHIHDTIAALDEDIHLVETNILNSEHNITVIEEELKVLDSFAKEHLELRTKYEAYLALAEEEKKKHATDSSFASLPASPKRQNSSVTETKAPEGEPLFSPKQAKLQDKEARNRWMEDSNSKVARVSPLVRSLQSNLREIDLHRGTLRTQLALWKVKHGGSKSLLNKLLQRKSDMEQYLPTTEKVSSKDE